MRLANVHSSDQPFDVSCFALGETVPAGKSMFLKLVFIARLKSRTCATPVWANAYVQLPSPRDRYARSSVTDASGAADTTAATSFDTSLLGRTGRPSTVNV